MTQIAYLRVSTDRQDEQSQRPDVQSMIEGDCEWVVEHGSAWKQDGLKNRPEFQRIQKLIKSGKVERLYCWDLDRLWRKRAQQVAFLQLCKARGCLVLSYRQKYLEEIKNAPAPWNEIIYDLIIQILAAIAEEESQVKSDRIRAKHKNWKKPVGKKEWGRPQVSFNDRRAYHLLFEENKSLQEVANEVGVSKGTIYRFKKVCEENPPSFIKDIGYSKKG